MKRIFSFLLAALLLVSAVPMAQATNDYTAGTKVEYVATGSESYTITVPAQLAPGGSGTVTLSGTWADNRVVTVKADPTVTLKNSIKETDTKTLNVNFDGISETGSNTTSQTFTKGISVDGITDALFGTWSGKFNYNVEINDVHRGLYYAQPYNYYWDGGSITYIFYEDGTAAGYTNGIYSDGGTYTMDDNSPSFGNPEYTYELSDDGAQFIMTKQYESPAALIVNTIPHDLYYGDYYTVSFDDDGDGTTDYSTSLVFYEDGSVGIYENYTLVESLPTGSAIYGENQIDMTDTLGAVLNVSIDGTQIILPGEDGFILTMETLDNFNPVGYYVGTDDYSAAFVLHIKNDNTVDLYLGSELADDATMAALGGAITYENGQFYQNNEVIGALSPAGLATINLRYNDSTLTLSAQKTEGLFTFTIYSDGDFTEGESFEYTCQAEVGMTWREWVDSEYNTIGAEIVYSNNYVGSDSMGASGDIISLNGCCLYSGGQTVIRNAADWLIRAANYEVGVKYNF